MTVNLTAHKRAHNNLIFIIHLKLGLTSNASANFSRKHEHQSDTSNNKRNVLLSEEPHQTSIHNGAEEEEEEDKFTEQANSKRRLNNEGEYLKTIFSLEYVCSNATDRNGTFNNQRMSVSFKSDVKIDNPSYHHTINKSYAITDDIT